MKVTQKVGLSYYTLDLNKEETKAWKQTKDIESFGERKRARHDIFIDAYTRVKFGSVENLKNSLKSLDSALTSLEKIM